MNKFKVGDLVTVINEESVWYAHLYDLRLELLGKTGRVVFADSLTFTKDDLEWYNIPKSNIPFTVYYCLVVFPHMPDRSIDISEIHLKLFELKRS